jgi:uncharacterized membrane protein
MIEIMSVVVNCESDGSRILTLRRHADIVLGDAERTVSTPSDLDDIRQRHVEFERARRLAPTPSQPTIHIVAG